MDGVARAGMGAAAGDFDNDGDEDVLVTNLTREGSTLYRNLSQQGNSGSFQDATQEFNLSQPSFLSTGFGVGWFDYDNDGWLDLFTANGAVTIIPRLKGTPYPFHQPNQLFHNEGKAASFREITPREETSLQPSEVGRGLAFGDLDNDGDTDLLVANNNGSARLLLNQTGNRRHWLTVRLEGVQDNRYGIGALITLQLRGQKPLFRQVRSDGSYLSASDSRVLFGLGAATEIERLTVRWPGGTMESWTGMKSGQQITLRQGAGKRRQLSK